ncbi:MAG: Ig-like domain-containing protein [Anaerolineae bacterium]|nr:Ig-like domain-containing protein [Anaerolineae bacterium]
MNTLRVPSLRTLVLALLALVVGVIAACQPQTPEPSPTGVPPTATQAAKIEPQTTQPTQAPSQPAAQATSQPSGPAARPTATPGRIVGLGAASFAKAQDPLRVLATQPQADAKDVPVGGPQCPTSSLQAAQQATAQAPSPTPPAFQAAGVKPPLSTAAEEPAPQPCPRLVVQFNHPVVPLVGVADQSTLPNPLTLDPPSQGKGEWLNTSTFAFYPTGLRANTKYTVTIAALTDLVGQKLDAPFTTSFTTAAPGVFRSQPAADARQALVNQPIRVVFNTAMNQGETQAAFSLRPQGGQPVEGSVSWEGTTLVFKPAQPLATGTTYQVQIRAGAKDAQGTSSLPADLGWTFQSEATPGLAASQPQNGATNYEGGVQLTFASPMDRDAFQYDIAPKPTFQNAYWQNPESTQVAIGGDWQPSTQYTVTVKGASKTRSGLTLGRDITLRFTTAPAFPRFQLGVPSLAAMYDANRPPTLSVASLNVGQFNLSLSRLPAADVANLLSENGYSLITKYTPPASARVREWTERVTAPLNATTVTTITLTTAPLPPGAYLLDISTPDKGPRNSDLGRPRHVLIVSEVNLLLKRSDREALVWATSLKTGQPVAGLPLRVFTAAGKDLGTGTTDQDGLLRLQFNPVQNPYTEVIALSERDGQVVAGVGSNWAEEIRSYNYGLDSAIVQPDFTAQLYTDRPIYRPGDKVLFRGIVRQGRDLAYSIPNLDTLRVELRQYGTRLGAQDVRLTPYGGFSGEFTLPAGLAPGPYQVQTFLGAEPGPDSSVPQAVAVAEFDVAEYRKPEFEATVKPDKVDYVNGETMNVTLDTAYFFGGPVADTALVWRVQTAPYTFPQPERLKGYWDFSDFDTLISRRPGPQPTPAAMPGRSGTGKTDKQGKFTFQVPANLGDKPTSQEFSVEVELTDASGQAVASRRTVVVHQGAFYIGLRPRSYLASVNQPANVDAIVVDTQGVSVTNQALTATVYRREWKLGTQKDQFGNTFPAAEPNDTQVASVPVTTNAQGAAVVQFTPSQAGTYRIVAEGKDSRGNTVRSATYVWVAGGETVAWRRTGPDRFDLTPDKKTYTVGDTARILVSVPFAPAEALLTVERAGIREVRRLSLKSQGETVEVPITAEMVPNIYVSVAAVQGGTATQLPQFAMGLVNLDVSTAPKVLTVSVAPDKPGPYLPGSTVTLNVEAKDAAGKPVQGEFSLALVDKAIYSLADDKTKPPVDVFYHPQQLGVETGASLVRNVNRLAARLQSGGGGGGGGDFAAPAPLRQDFRDTAFWQPTVVTDAQGKARVDVKLPDNTTTWVVNVLGATRETLVGQARLETMASKPFFVRPALPRFLMQGDQVKLAAVVQNNTTGAVSGQVTLQTRGLDGKVDPIRVNVPAQGSQRVEWDAVVGAVDEAQVTFAVDGGGQSDAVQIKVPVYRPATPETVGTAGMVTERADEVIRVPVEAANALGGLTVNLNPSLAAVTSDGLRYLETYEWDSTENVVSRFLVSVASLRMAQAMNLPVNREAVAAKVQDDLQLLYRRQNQDNGWGWWQEGVSNPFLTAYAVFGLQTAKAAGLDVNTERLERALTFLQESANQPLEPGAVGVMSQRAFILYVLAEAGRPDVAKMTALYNQRNDMSLYGQGYLMLALQRADAQGQAQRVQALAQNFVSQAKLGATGAKWEEAVQNPNTLNTDVRTTSIILLGLARVSPQEATLPNAVRWLMSARGGNSAWRSTQETAWAILALTEYLTARGETGAAYSYSVNLNGKDLKTGQVTAANMAEGVRVSEDLKNLVTNAGNNLTISKQGQGTLYYTAHLTYYPSAEQIQALDRGIIVGRQYLAVDPLTLQPTGQPAQSVRVGDYVQIRVTLIAPTTLHYVVVEDPLPAGFEAVDVSLKTASQAASGPSLVKGPGPSTPPQPAGLTTFPWDRPYWNVWSHSEVRDAKVAVFASELSAGVYEYTYLARASAAGQFKALPTTAYEMYFPDVFGRSAGALFAIRPAE